MKNKGGYSRDAFTAVAEETVKRSGPSVTEKAEQRAREGLGLHDLVDPAKYGIVRRSLTYYQDLGDGRYTIPRGVAMPWESRSDTTGSMGYSIDGVMIVLPTLYDLLIEGPSPVLGRYDLHVSNGAFGDRSDQFVLMRPQFETDERVLEQMTYIVPERAGDDHPEDPHYGWFAAAFLTHRSINLYDLKAYDTTITDAPARLEFDADIVERIFGKDVWQKATENGYQLNPRKLPSVRDVVAEMQKRVHGYVAVVQRSGYESAVRFYTSMFGSDHVVVIPTTSELGRFDKLLKAKERDEAYRLQEGLHYTALLPAIQAAIIGLTEGTLDLQGLRDYLTSKDTFGNSAISTVEAKAVVDAVKGIAIGAQAVLPNFSKLPPKFSIFANKNDLWPVEAGSGSSDKGESGVWL